MRKLEFRAWDVERVGAYNGCVYQNDQALWEYFRDLNDDERRYDCKFVYMQYTGLKDKNGVKIFEGDIVSLLCNKRNSMESWDVTRLAIIKNEPPAFYFKVIGEADNVYIPSMLDVTFIEVIGNIYENPELLSEVK